MKFLKHSTKWQLVLLLMIVFNVARAQTSVKGTVTDADESTPLIGVTVALKGSSTGTVTDLDGNYSLSVPGPTAVLTFSYTGYGVQEVTVGNKSQVDVSMVAGTDLDEIVVIGYGSVKKSDVTGAVSSISADDYKDQPVTRLEDALQGRAAGVSVAKSNGQPGSDFKIRIRGVNSITGDNSPLVVVDGIQGIDLSTLNPNDIQSIDVLKDASATAIYGVRGSNGVIIVTTKRGKGQGKVNLEYFTTSAEVPGFLPTLQDDVGAFTRLENLRRVNAGGNPNFTDAEISALEAGGGTQWQEEIFQTGVGHNLLGSVSGSEGKINYFISGVYRDQEGIVINTGFKQISLRSNIDAQINDKLKIGLNVFANRDQAQNDFSFSGNGQGSLVSKALTWDPTTPVFADDGSYNFRSLRGIASLNDNPVRTLQESDAQRVREQLSTAVNIGWSITDQFTYTLNAGTRLNNINNQIYDVEVGDDFLPHTNFGNSKFQAYQVSHILSWENTFGANDVKLTGVQEYVNETNIFNGWSAQDLSLPRGFYFAELAPGAGQTVRNNFSERELSSYMLRAEYVMDDKLFVTATGRYDGTSVFRENNRWGFFPSLALGYSLDDMLGAEGALSSMKVRLGWGQVGSQNIGPYSTFGGLRTNASYSFDSNSAQTGTVLSSFENADLTWETTTQTNIGLDLGILEGRGSVTIEYFSKKTTDLLLATPVPGTFGGGIVNQNVGEVTNNGIDFSLGYTIINTANFDWDASFNVSYVKNEVTQLYNDLEQINGLFTSPGGQSRVLNIIELGQPLGQFQGSTFLGTWKTAEAATAAEFGASPGDPKYLRDAEGEIVFGSIGNGTPEVVWGFNNSFTYKKFTLNVFFQGMHGFDVYNIQQAMITGGAGDSRSFLSADQVNQWTPTNETDVPATVQFYNSSRYIEKGDFIRLANLNLGYDFGAVGNTDMSLRVYASGQNLLLITDYTGYDPELSSSRGSQGNADVAPGINIGAYPNPRTYTFGFKLGF
jgi:TonB-linked SusC/RagA family outer membrane protein